MYFLRSHCEFSKVYNVGVLWVNGSLHRDCYFVCLLLCTSAVAFRDSMLVSSVVLVSLAFGNLVVYKVITYCL